MNNTIKITNKENQKIIMKNSYPTPEIKIEEKIITENGTYNASIDSLQGYNPVVVDVPVGIFPSGSYNITKNGTYDVTDKETAIVNVASTGGGLEPITNASYLFYDGARLENEKLLTENISSTCKNFSYMYRYCSSLKNTSPINTSSGTNFSYMYDNCRNVRSLPDLDTSQGTNFENMYNNCTLLTKIPNIDTTLATSLTNFANGCSALIEIPALNGSSCKNVSFFANVSNLEIFGGLIDYGKAFSVNSSQNNMSYQLSFTTCKKLTYQSTLNILNGLYDIGAKGCKPQLVRINSTPFSLLTADEISIATSKGWSVTT